MKQSELMESKDENLFSRRVFFCVIPSMTV